MTDTADSASLARKCIALFNTRTLAWIGTCYAESVDWRELPLPATPSGQQGNRAALRFAAGRVLALFPDRTLTIRNLIAASESVALELDWTGTPAATVGSFTAGKPVSYRIASFLTIAGGLIVRQTDYCVPLG